MKHFSPKYQILTLKPSFSYRYGTFLSKLDTMHITFIVNIIVFTKNSAFFLIKIALRDLDFHHSNATKAKKYEFIDYLKDENTILITRKAIDDRKMFIQCIDIIS